MELLNLDNIPTKIKENKCINVYHLNIFISDNDSNQGYINTKVISSLPYIAIHFSNNRHFFSFKINSFLKFFEGNNIDLNKTIFIFKNTSWKQLQILFRTINMILSGGATAKRHILSPAQYRLSQFLLYAFDAPNALVPKSFHSEKEFIEDTPASTGPPVNVNSKYGLDLIKKAFNNKRSFNTSSVINSDKNINNNPKTILDLKLKTKLNERRYQWYGILHLILLIILSSFIGFKPILIWYIIIGFIYLIYLFIEFYILMLFLRGRMTMPKHIPLFLWTWLKGMEKISKYKIQAKRAFIDLYVRNLIFYIIVLSVFILNYLDFI